MLGFPAPVNHHMEWGKAGPVCMRSHHFVPCLKEAFCALNRPNSILPHNFLTLGTFANYSPGWEGDQECQNTMGRGCSVILPTCEGGGNAGNPLSTPVFLRFPTRFCKLRRFYIIWFSQFRGLRHLAMHLDCIFGVSYPKKNSDRTV